MLIHFSSTHQVHFVRYVSRLQVHDFYSSVDSTDYDEIYQEELQYLEKKLIQEYPPELISSFISGSAAQPCPLLFEVES